MQSCPFQESSSLLWPPLQWSPSMNFLLWVPGRLEGLTLGRFELVCQIPVISNRESSCGPGRTLLLCTKSCFSTQFPPICQPFFFSLDAALLFYWPQTQTDCSRITCNKCMNLHSQNCECVQGEATWVPPLEHQLHVQPLTQRNSVPDGSPLQPCWPAFVFIFSP